MCDVDQQQNANERQLLFWNEQNPIFTLPYLNLNEKFRYVLRISPQVSSCTIHDADASCLGSSFLVSEGAAANVPSDCGSFDRRFDGGPSS